MSQPKQNVRARVFQLSFGLLAALPLGATEASLIAPLPEPALPVRVEAEAPAAPDDDAALRGWVVEEENLICGISDPRHMSNPAVVDYEDCLEATSAWKEMKRKGIEADSIEGRALRKRAATAVTKAAQVVREAGGYCSVWKAVRHTDGRHIPDVTEDVKERL